MLLLVAAKGKADGFSSIFSGLYGECGRGGATDRTDRYLMPPSTDPNKGQL